MVGDRVPEALDQMRSAVEHRAKALAGLCVVDGRVSTPKLDENQEAAYRLAFLAAETAAAEAIVEYGEFGDAEGLIATVGLAELVHSSRSRFDGYEGGAELRGGALDEVLRAGSAPEILDAVVELLPTVGTGRRHLADDVTLVADTFARFAREQVVPHAERVHRENEDVPEAVIEGMARMGAFGMSIPAEYGGFRQPEDGGMLSMVVATEELSRGSLMAGSLLTRPEILVAALLAGGTEAQKRRWLPAIAAGEQMVAVAVTEPDYGSDVAAITTTALADGGEFVLNGTKMWATFAGRAELLMVLARTDPDRSARARGLSLFVIEKPPFSGHGFQMEQSGGGRLSGRAIDTIGYRGLHSFEVVFDDWRIPADALIGEQDGAGRGFSLQMGVFASGRLQTAARALGVMEAAFAEGLAYAAGRVVFGRPLLGYQLTGARLARMAARIQAGRRLTYRAAALLDTAEGSGLAAMAKALTSRAAEEVTRDAMQLHGGYGYAEEYPVSRLFVDARVLSIFEGTEEVLALRVIARDLLRQLQP